MANDKNLQQLLSELRRSSARKQSNAEKQLRAIYKEMLRELQTFVSEEYVRFAKDGILSYSILQQKGEYARFMEEITSCVTGLSPKITEEIRKVVNETYELSYKGLVDAINEANDIEVLEEKLKSVKATTPEVVKRAVNNPIEKLTLNDTLEHNRQNILYNIRKQVSLGLVNGDRHTEMAKRIAGSLDGDYKKALLIARTETHKVREQGLNDAAKQCSKAIDSGKSELIMVKVWRTGKDERVRSSHQPMEGKVALVDEEFDLPTGHKAMTPSSSGVASEDINCRCFLSYKLMSVSEYEKATGKKYEKVSQTETDTAKQVTTESKVSDIPDKQAFKDWFEETNGSGHYKFDEIFEEFKENGEAVDELLTRLVAGRSAGVRDKFKQNLVDNLDKLNQKSLSVAKETLESSAKRSGYSLGKQSSDRHSVETYDKWKKAIEKETGSPISDERVKEMLDAIQDYTAENYLDICAASADFDGMWKNYSDVALGTAKERAKAKAQAEAVEELLKTAPKYEGTVYRGLGFEAGGEYDTGNWERFLNQMSEGNIIKMENVSSWTTSESVARQFAIEKSSFEDYADLRAEVIMVLNNSKKGVKIAELAEKGVQYQEEVLFSKEVEYKITKIKKTTEKAVDGTEDVRMTVYVDEV